MRGEPRSIDYVRLLVLFVVGCSFRHGVLGNGGAGDDAAPSIDTAMIDTSMIDTPMIDTPPSCTTHTLPPALNVDPTTWAASFLTAPTWSCTAAGTTTISVNGGSVSFGSTSCAIGTMTPFTNDVAQGSGPNVLVVRLQGLTITNGHVLKLTGDKPIVLLVAGNVVVDTGGMIDASASGGTPGPGGSLASVCADQTSGLGQPSSGGGWGGGGGGFGTAGGQGCYNITNGGLAVSSTLVPLRGGCGGGISMGSSVAAGAGGGAFEISASGTIAIGATGAANLVASGGGAPAFAPGGGNGGGAGGGILLVSPAAATFGTTGAARANGGAGSSGCSSCTANDVGGDGHKTDSTQATDSSGIAGGGNGNDHGRAGGLADRVGTGAVSQAGDLTTAQIGGRGGGGGGGGVILVTTGATSTSCD